MKKKYGCIEIIPLGENSRPPPKIIDVTNNYLVFKAALNKTLRKLKKTFLKNS